MRQYHSDIPEENDVLQSELAQFKQRGGAMTFEVNFEIYQQLGFEGYRYFRVVQTGRNTGNSNQLCMSGLGLYGRVLAGRWP